MKLVIVESPTKAKTIGKFLGKGYQLESSYGHVRDLPKGKLGVDEEKNFEPGYVIPTKSRKRVNQLKKTATDAEEVILATDEDREGEAIAWHLVYALGLEDQENIKRIVFHEITKSAIEGALAKPRKINTNLVDAQQARRIIDRLVGYKLSPFLWKKIRGGLSAGRVQSVALKLIVDREEEIRKFKPQEYWTIKAKLEASKGSFEAELNKIGSRKLDKLDIKKARDAQLIANDIQRSESAVLSVVKKPTTRKPLPPFITSTLQQDASRRLRFSAKKTMMVAQKLYERGLITYMRTDSVNLSREAIAVAKDWLAKNLGAQYSSSSPRVYKSRSKLAQEAHEAIRPTNPALSPEDTKGTDDEKKLYDLIWRRFMASQMPDAKFEQTTIDVRAKGVKETYNLRANGNIMKFDGFLRVWLGKGEDVELPDVEKQEQLKVLKTTPDQHFTEPPARFNEASLIKTLEEYGIGRPSTYAPIISVIQNRGYVIKDKNRRFEPEEIGELVNKILAEHFPNIVDIDFTARMEEEFDEVAEGIEKWRDVVKEFYEPFIENLDKKYTEVKKEEIAEEQTDVDCDDCGKKMIIKFGRFGKFMACSGYPECKNTKTLKEPPEKIGLNCPECHEGDIIKRFTKRRKIFYGCSRYPKCDYASWDDPREKKEEKGDKK
ncbi:MAG: type I DNA topoisomerase [Candidatus Colwellbacteria bacterium CG10_big_fil_rev_8_21_14_0_10_42_22]|uniref:DNA topoisomerase 1 n=1 Tax=Candidatus Colwellbacteria bacterium CG10_big_fil_rev_8_21_14_0_10_42_22 TaxID=1974540 RepID=A0A2H0VG14_9BACT|nr:MAG: type I DNA topoisomerase [Candidatus Colwellbacteria bacterium CG10_big_fil_rev_8_21_14_0_10_42_22]